MITQRHIVAALLSANVLAQVQWTELQPATRPPVLVANSFERLVYDDSRELVVATRTQATFPLTVFETWEWDGVTWIPASPAVSPSGRRHQALAYDAARGEIVMFGGQTNSGMLSETWLYDGSTWTFATSVGPVPRMAASIAFDSARDEVVMFGGMDTSAARPNDTWAWNGNAWIQRTSGTAPAGRTGAAMTFDERRSELLLFGGNLAASVPLNDTWVWDGSSWQQRSPTQQPTARTDLMMAYDGARDRVVVFAGHDACCGTFYHDTWEWDGTDWMQRATGNAPRTTWMTNIAYDAARQQIVLFGGQDGFIYPNENATWVYEPTTPGAFSLVAAGCPGSAGVPSIALAAPRMPYVGDSFELSFGDLPLGPRYAFAIVGLPVASPVSLGPIGLPSCALHTTFWGTISAVTATGSWEVEFAIPASATWIGVQLAFQSLVFDAPANSVGIVPGDAASITIGSK